MRQRQLTSYILLPLLCLATSVIANEPDGNPDPEITIEIETTPADTTLLPQDTSATLDNEPKLIKFINAEYPVALQKLGTQGNVRLALLVSEKGTVDSVGIVTGCHPMLDSNAAAAAKQFLFTPATVAGEPVAVLLEYDYSFSLTRALTGLDTAVNFSGTLLEMGTRTPISDAIVSVVFEDTISDTTLPVPFSTYLSTIGGYPGQSLEAGKIIATTDSLGRFSFRALPACSVLVTCLIPDYERFWQREVISADARLSVVYRPARKSYSEYEIVVYGKAEEREVSRRQISKNEIKKIPGVGGDAVRVVQALPGVGRPTMGNGDIVVRGSRPWDSGYFIGGLRIPQLYHLDGLKSVYNTEALETVNFYPGGTGVRHGGYTSGIVEIVPRKARTDRLHGYGELNGMDVTFSLEGPINNNISFLVAARRSFFGDVMSKAFEKLEEWGENLPMWILLYYWDYAARVDMKINDHQQVSLSALGSRDSLSLIFNQFRGGSTEIESTADRLGTMRRFSLFSADWQWEISPKISNTLQYGLTINREQMSAFATVKMNREGVSHQVRDEFKIKLCDNLLLYPGIDILLSPIDFALTMPDGTGVIRNDTRNDWLFGILGAYLFAEYKATDRLTLTPGIRFDYYPELTYQGAVLPQFGPYGDKTPVWRGSGEPSLRVNAKYAINNRHALKAAVGTYSQTPQPVGWVIHPTWGNLIFR